MSKITDADAQLVRSFQGNRDRKSFELLYGKYKDDIFDYCCRFLNDEDEAADCTQEIFIRAFRHISSFRFESKFSTWLFRIAVNACYNAVRNRSKHVKERYYDIGERVREPSPDPHQQLSIKEVGEAFHEGLEKLKEAQRSIIILRDLEGKSYEEIALISNMNPGTVKSTLARARFKMAEHLKDYRNGM